MTFKNKIIWKIISTLQIDLVPPTCGPGKSFTYTKKVEEAQSQKNQGHSCGVEGTIKEKNSAECRPRVRDLLQHTPSMQIL